MGVTWQLATAKGYKGRLDVALFKPSIQLGDPGYIEVSSLTVASAVVTDETDGGRPVWATSGGGTLLMTIYAAWKIPKEWAKYAQPDAGCPGCDYSNGYLVSEARLENPEGVGTGFIQVTPTRPLNFVPQTSCIGCPGAARFSPIYGAPENAAVAQLPETEQGRLAELLNTSPDVIYVAPPTNVPGGFMLGDNTDHMISMPCIITGSGGTQDGYVIGIADMKGPGILKWPESHSTPGTPCYANNTAAPPK
ncbi:hypothetical protein GCM10023063_17310 [Arthrobacter methylotrophus]|uniref:Uncharacterized protein n=2 Tax=Arthrobacter methylotrophus TaxID=121291 RepID=A0ABV5UNP0_9MICC